MTTRPVVFGEILFDHFPSGDEVLGGAPLNVAAHLAALGEAPLVVSRVGLDAAGERALAELDRRGIDRSAVQRDPDLPTGRVEVSLDGGSPSFEILPHRAWDAIDADQATAALEATRPGLLYHGTLAAREETSRAALLALRAAAAGVPVVVDVNLRPPWTPPARARELAHRVAWLKVSRDELSTLVAAPAGERDLDAAAAALRGGTGAERLVVTDGERGAALYDDRGARHVPAPTVGSRRLVDAVGAGDAFAAATILGVRRGWPAELALRRAAELAAAICTVRGALPADDVFYAPFRDAWELAA